MEPDNPSPTPEIPLDPQQIQSPPDGALAPQADGPTPAPSGPDGIRWVFMGPQGLRAGWSVLIFFAVLAATSLTVNTLIRYTHLLPKPPAGGVQELTPRSGFISELIGVLSILFAAWVVSRIERRRLTDYYLSGPGRVSRFFSGLLTGFAMLSLIVGGLVAGGWMHFGGLALSGSRIALYAVAWAGVFLLVGCAEEGLARCYLLYTLARGLNFWWALGISVCLCVLVALNPKASGLWGAYLIALLGVAPCLALHVKKAPGEGFWCAAWATSVFFGAGHTANPGENWVGIFAAAGIGFVFCASVRLTGSVWWAIGCHASWDWGESFFYGTPDSGLLAKGHLFNTTYSGPAVWSGGADGPEGSLLVIPIMLLILLVLVVFYGRKRQAAVAAPLAEHVAG